MAGAYRRNFDPANPQVNFVKATFENKGDRDGFYKYMYGDYSCGPMGEGYNVRKKASGFSHGVGQRAGKLRLSGSKGAHRLGKR